MTDGFDYFGSIIEQTKHVIGGLYDPSRLGAVAIISIPWLDVNDEDAPDFDGEPYPCAFHEREEAASKLASLAGGTKAARALRDRAQWESGKIEVVVADFGAGKGPARIDMEIRTVWIHSALEERSRYLDVAFGRYFAALRSTLHPTWLPKGRRATAGSLRSSTCPLCVTWTKAALDARLLRPEVEHNVVPQAKTDRARAPWCRSCAADVDIVVETLRDEGFRLAPHEIRTGLDADRTFAWYDRHYRAEGRPKVRELREWSKLCADARALDPTISDDALESIAATEAPHGPICDPLAQPWTAEMVAKCAVGWDRRRTERQQTAQPAL